MENNVILQLYDNKENDCVRSELYLSFKHSRVYSIYPRWGNIKRTNPKVNFKI